MKKRKMKIIKCLYCNAEKETRADNKTQKFCSISCAAKKRHEDGPENHPSWKGGKILNHKGYVMIKMPKHHRANKNGYVFEHIIVAEKKVGREINANEHVHHKDEDKQNNHPDNLEVISPSEHARLTHAGKLKGSYLVCPVCEEEFYRKPSHVEKSIYCSYSCSAKGNDIAKYKRIEIPIDDIINLVTSGKTLIEISNTFSVHRSTIHKKIKQAGYSGVREIKKHVK